MNLQRLKIVFILSRFPVFKFCKDTMYINKLLWAYPVLLSQLYDRLQQDSNSNRVGKRRSC